MDNNNKRDKHVCLLTRYINGEEGAREIARDYVCGMTLHLVYIPADGLYHVISEKDDGQCAAIVSTTNRNMVEAIYYGVIKAVNNKVED